MTVDGKLGNFPIATLYVADSEVRPDEMNDIIFSYKFTKRGYSGSH